MILIICYDALDQIQLYHHPLSIRFKWGHYKSKYSNTVPSWTSIYTGLTLEEHGMGEHWPDFLKRTSGIEDFQCVWDDINDMGYTVGLYNLPLTYPAFEVDGWVVSGFPSGYKPERMTYPTELYDELVDPFVDIYKKFGEYDLRVGKLKMEDTLSHVPYIIEIIDNRISNLSTIYNNHPVDVLFVGFSFLDHAGHLGFDINKMYKNGIIDTSIRVLFDLCKPDKSLIVSDHGAVFLQETLLMHHTSDATIGIIGEEFDTPVPWGGVIEDYEIYEWDIKKKILDLVKGNEDS